MINSDVLAQLAALFVDTPRSPDRFDEDSPLDAGEFAARAGLTLERSPLGDVKVVGDPFPEARLCRMWGDTWADYQTPMLLSADELATAAAVPPAAVDAIRSVTTAVDEVLEAAARVAAPEDADALDADPGLSTEEETWWALVDRATDILAEDALTLTNHLPTIRAAAQLDARH